MLFLAVLLITQCDALETKPGTFQLNNPVRGDTLTCDLCQPGTYMAAFCTATDDTLCLPCPSGHFTQFWNYLPKCLYCTNFCDETQFVKEECTPKMNRVCECKEGYYWLGDFCVKHTKCSSGFGTKQIGTVNRNTECEKCPQGTFSAETSSRAPCVNHTDCGDDLVVLRGTNWHDNICSKCTDLKDGGDKAVLRRVLPILFTKANLNRRKLRRFVHLLYRKKQLENSRSAKEVLLRLVNDWFKTAKDYELLNLPPILLKSGFSEVNTKLQRMLKKLHRRTKQC